MTCNAKTRQGSPCQLPAGWGTDHAGEGRCKLHGGASTGPIKHGRYSVKHRAKLAEKAAQFYNDPAPYEVDSELALMRALLQDYLDRFIEDVKMSASDINVLMGMLETITRLVERIVKMLNQTALTQAEVEYLKARMADELPRYIPDTAEQIAFIRAVFGTGGYGHGIRTAVTAARN